VLEGIISLTVGIWFVAAIRLFVFSPDRRTWLILLIGVVVLFLATTLDLIGDIIGKPGLAMQFKNFSFAIGAILFTVGFLQWSSWTIRNIKQLEDIAVKDELTQLFNRRGFLQHLSKEIDRSQRLNHGFTLLILDLNNFKLINDTHGHPVGDDILRRVAAVLRNEFRSYDILGRIGGDEFAAILPDSCPEDGLKASERIKKAVKEAFSGTEFEISLAVGAAFFPLEAKTADKLLIVADKRMYENKRSMDTR